MPSQNGSFSAEELAHISKTVNARWEGRPDACPICGQTQWIIGDRFVAPTSLGLNGAQMLGGTIYPMVIMFSPCGYVRMMSATMLGLYPYPLGKPPTPEVPPPPPSSTPEKKA